MLSQHQSKAINTLRRCLSLCSNQPEGQPHYEIEATANLNLARSLALMPSLPNSGSGGGGEGGDSLTIRGSGIMSLLSSNHQIWEALSKVNASSPGVIAINLNSISNASTNPNPAGI